MASSAQRVIRDPRFARGGVATARPAAAPWSPALPDDTRILAEAFDSYEALLRIGCQRALPNTTTLAEADSLRRSLTAAADAISAARAWLAIHGAEALLHGKAGDGLLGLASSALACHLEALQSSAELQLAAEFGDVVLGQTDDALEALARRMDPRYDAARTLEARLQDVSAALAG
jgi:hypothetical protein